MSKSATKYVHDDVANGKNESQLVKKYKKSILEREREVFAMLLN
jgi:hypothetical protein